MSPEQTTASSLACRGAILLLLSVWAVAAASPELPTRDQIDSIMKQLSTITGLRVKHPVHFQSITRGQVSRYLNDRAKASVSAKDIDAEETALKMLGFVPADFDLRKTTLDLMTEQAAAFYDYHRKSLFLTDWAPHSMRDTAVVHELAHALADQNFNLGRFVGKAGDDERSTARDAVVEGQATYLMEAYDLAEDGQNPLGIHPDYKNLDDPANPSGEYPIFDKAPLYLRETLVFPYTWGMAFQAVLVDRLGKEAFSEVFRHPPVSTHQIFHPEIYLSGATGDRLFIPRAPKKSKILIEGELGELDHRILLEQFVSRSAAQRVGPEWRSGFFQVLENKKDHSRSLIYGSLWSDEKMAKDFFGLYRRCLAGKSKHLTLTQAGDDMIAGRNDAGYFRVIRDGRSVGSVEYAAQPL